MIVGIFSWIASKVGGLVVSRLGGWPVVIAVGVGLALVAGTFLWQRAHIRNLRLELAAASLTASVARHANEETQAAFDSYIEETRRAFELVEREAAAARQAAADLATIEAEILHAPETDNAPAAPVLSRTLERLRQLETGRDP
jgi:hypothetical protein